MTITAPNSTEWVKDGKATPVFIQYLDQFKDWINERQGVLNVEAGTTDEVEEEVEASKLAQLSAHTMVPLESDYYDPDGMYHSEWLTSKADLAVGPFSTSNVNRMYVMFSESNDEMYYLINKLIARIDELEAALVASGQLEIT